MKKIKVAHIITRLIIGGAQENTVFSVEGLMANPGYEVDLITGPPLGPEGSLMYQVTENDLPVILVNQMRRAINPLRDLATLIHLYILIRRKRYDIVHTHSSKAGILGRIAARLARTKIIIHTIHGLPFHQYEKNYINWLYKSLERRVARFTDKIIVVAQRMKDYALEARIGTPEQFCTIYSGMDVPAFIEANQKREGTRNQLGILPDEIVIGKIARLFYFKGHEYLLEVAPKIIQAFPRIKFLLVGDGILKPALEKTINSLGLKGRFILTGLVKPEEIPPLIGAMDILIHLSLREGLARSLPQALAGGKPVISFDIDGAREVVIPDETGILVTPCNTSELNAALTTLLSDSALRKTMGEKGRKLVTPRFERACMVEKIEELYRELLIQSGKR